MTDTSSQIRQMVDFIRLEAKEKAAELRTKAAADAHMEKQNAVRDAKMKLADDYERKEKALAVEQRIKASMDESKQRSRLLSSRDEYIQKLGVEAKQRLGAVATSNATAYGALLKDLIKQSLNRLEGEATAEVHCRPQDLAVATKAAVTASTEIKTETKRVVTVTTVADSTLGGGAGGVIVWAQGGRIKCNNTLEDRLALIVNDLTPVIRDLLFPSARAEVRVKPPVHFAHLHAAPAPAPAPKPAPVAAKTATTSNAGAGGVFDSF